jgi:hypothetical protein
MQKKKNIFDNLFDLKIPFSVGVSFKYLKNKQIDISTKEYFIIITMENAIDLKLNHRKQFLRKLFRKDIGFPKISTYDLKEKNVSVFREMQQDMFDVVINNKNGIIYELKENSFKKYLETSN